MLINKKYLLSLLCLILPQALSCMEVRYWDDEPNNIPKHLTLDTLFHIFENIQEVISIKTPDQRVFLVIFSKEGNLTCTPVDNLSAPQIVPNIKAIAVDHLNNLLLTKDINDIELGWTINGNNLVKSVIPGENKEFELVINDVIYYFVFNQNGKIALYQDKPNGIKLIQLIGGIHQKEIDYLDYFSNQDNQSYILTVDTNKTLNILYIDVNNNNRLVHIFQHHGIVSASYDGQSNILYISTPTMDPNRKWTQGYAVLNQQVQSYGSLSLKKKWNKNTMTKELGKQLRESKTF